MSKVIIIGAGASGVIASIKASDKNEVVLLDGNNSCCKKILVTGNGRCNYWNSDINILNYQTDNYGNLKNIINDNNQKEVLSYLESIGLYPKIKNGCYYPYSNQASSVKEIFTRELNRHNISVINNFKVENVSVENDKFTVISENGEILNSDKLIIAAGSCAFSKTGSDGSGYKFAKKLGHTINDVTPSLVSLIASENYLKDWSGVRTDARVSVYVNNEKIKDDLGEIQLTSNGISGICVFNVSGIASKNLSLGKNVEVKINFLPKINEGFYNWFNRRNEIIKGYTISELMESVINYKLLNVILKKSNINGNLFWNELTQKQKLTLTKNIEEFSLEIKSVNDFNSAQTCTGGVSLGEINPNNMESNITPNLYIVGEVLDVDGICGGYNLAFAFISGYLAGKNI